MQTPVGLTPDQYATLLTSNASLTTTISLFDLNMKFQAELTAKQTTGQIDWVDGAVTRTLSLEVYDADHSLHLDSSSPEDGAVYADRIVQVTQTLKAGSLSGSVTAFTGSLVKFQRQGSLVQIEAQGLEGRALTDVPSMTLKKGTAISEAIKSIMKNRCGETRFRGFDSPSKRTLKKDVTVGRDEKKWPWNVCLDLADSLGQQLFYSGDGYCTLRNPSEDAGSAFELTALGDITASHDWTQIYNRCEVNGKKKLHVVVEMNDIARNHPFSPSNMARQGVNWNRTLVISDDHIDKHADAVAVGKARLKKASSQFLAISFDALPVWHLDPLDLVKVNGVHFIFREGSAPLGDGSMSVGFNKKVRKPGVKR